MVTVMTQEELSAFYDKVSELTERGGEAEVREYVEYNYPRLPENVRNEILFGALTDAVNDAVREEEVVHQVIEEGLTTAEQLLDLKEKIEGEEKPKNP